MQRPLLLVVYWNPYGRNLRSAVRSHLRAVCRAAAGSVVAVNAHGGAPPALRRLRPDAVALHTTFLGARWTSDFPSWRERSDWIGALGAPVLAFPQDDYDHARVLDDWLVDLGTTDVFTALPEFADVLYPATRAAGARMHPVLTGYVDGRLLELAHRAWSERPLDVVYRAARLPYWFGRLGALKSEVGIAAADAARRLELRADIAVGPDSVIAGDAWYRFLAAGRVVVGAESGASVIDPDGGLRTSVTEFLSERPAASYEEVTRAVPADWDARWFGVVSPRHFEAAATRTAQVLVAGSYSGVLEAGRHYVPVAPDLSDIDAALSLALQPDVAAPMVERAYADIVASGAYSYDRLTDAFRAVLPRSSGRGRVRGAWRASAAARASDGRARLASLRRS